MWLDASARTLNWRSCASADTYHASAPRCRSVPFAWIRKASAIDAAQLTFSVATSAKGGKDKMIKRVIAAAQKAKEEAASEDAEEEEEEEEEVPPAPVQQSASKSKGKAKVTASPGSGPTKTIAKSRRPARA